VPLPKNHQLSQETQLAEVLEWPEDGTLTGSTVIIKTLGTHHLWSAPAGMVFVDTVKQPSTQTQDGDWDLGIRVPVIKPGIITKK
jgi:hypothetical protein